MECGGEGGKCGKGECEEGESVKRGECEEGDKEWRNRFGWVDWIFFSV